MKTLEYLLALLFTVGWIPILLIWSAIRDIKEKIWDKPQQEISELKREIKKLNQEIKKLNQDNIFLKESRRAAISQLTTHQTEELDEKLLAERIKALNDSHQKELNKRLTDSHIRFEKELAAVQRSTKAELDEMIFKYESIQLKYLTLKKCIERLNSNVTAIPYMAGMIADIETYGLETLAQKLNWGSSQERLKKVKSIREIRKDAQAMVERNKEAQYQLAYLLELYPGLADVIECDFKELPPVEVSELSDHDSTRDYLSHTEYYSLSVTERNQLALDRYVSSHSKTNWQIGRDYEQYVSYEYRKKGYSVDNFGSYMGLEDLGRDIIAKKGNSTLIIQCKYWSSVKLIHEKHITQLYGTMVSYCVENDVPRETVKGVLITNIQLSDMAKKIAEHLGIEYIENYAMGSFPRIKCNIGHSEGMETKIYHLPFDQQYDSTKISKPGEFYAVTVAEAEAAGFRRTFKWFGNK